MMRCPKEIASSAPRLRVTHQPARSECEIRWQDEAIPGQSYGNHGRSKFPHSNIGKARDPEGYVAERCPCLKVGWDGIHVLITPGAV
jgi:hypothetical protein